MSIMSAILLILKFLRYELVASNGNHNFLSLLYFILFSWLIIFFKNMSEDEIEFFSFMYVAGEQDI